MTGRFLGALVVTVLALPRLTLLLLRCGVHAAPLTVASGSTEGSGPDATHPHPSYAQPVVTSLTAKAGHVRRVDVGPPPCHDCRCCRAYETRMQTAHAEIDRLRHEIEAADTRRINQPHVDRTPFGTPAVPWQASGS